MSYKQKVKEMYDMLSQGQMMDAFEKYYAENVVMQEIGEDARVGKDANRQYELAFLQNVEAVHGMGVDSIASDEDNAVTHVENWMDLTFKGGNRVTLKQVAVQRWNGDQIVDEKFYHR